MKKPVGPKKENNPKDVKKVQTILSDENLLDIEKTDGPTGYFGSREERAIKDYQNKKGLKKDGVINPNGQTIKKMEGNLKRNISHQIKANSVLGEEPNDMMKPKPLLVSQATDLDVDDGRVGTNLDYESEGKRKSEILLEEGKEGSQKKIAPRCEVLEKSIQDVDDLIIPVLAKANGYADRLGNIASSIARIARDFGDLEIGAKVKRIIGLLDHFEEKDVDDGWNFDALQGFFSELIDINAEGYDDQVRRLEKLERDFNRTMNDLTVYYVQRDAWVLELGNTDC